MLHGLKTKVKRNRNMFKPLQAHSEPTRALLNKIATHELRVKIHLHALLKPWGKSSQIAYTRPRHGEIYQFHTITQNSVERMFFTYPLREKQIINDSEYRYIETGACITQWYIDVMSCSLFTWTVHQSFKPSEWIEWTPKEYSIEIEPEAGWQNLTEEINSGTKFLGINEGVYFRDFITAAPRSYNSLNFQALMSEVKAEEEKEMKELTSRRRPLKDVVQEIVRKRKRTIRSSTPPPRGKISTRKTLKVPKTKLERERNKLKLMYPNKIVIVKIASYYEIYEEDALKVVEKTNLTLQDPAYTHVMWRFKHHTSFHEDQLSLYLTSFQNLGIAYNIMEY